MSKTMTVFVTGASGWIGREVVRQLRAAGHQVLGMTHSDEGAERLKTQGVELYRADLRQPQSLVDGIRATDATIHLAFHMEFSDFAKINEIDRAAVGAMLGAMEGTNKAFVGTSGTLVVAHPGQVARETDRLQADTPVAVRIRAEELVLEAARSGVRGSVIRLAPTVHGAGDKGFIAMLIRLARERGVAGYIEAGDSHWPAVHRDDAARLFCLAVERAPAGSVLHATAEVGVSQREIATAIGEGLGLPVVSVKAADASAHFGWMAGVLGLDNRASSEATQKLLDWKPARPRLLEDIRKNYF